MAAVSTGGLKVKDLVMHVVNQRRPWTELADRTAYSRPTNITEATGRIRKNINYFKVNYLIWLVTVVIVCMLASPSSLIWLGAISSAWAYVFVVRQEPLLIGGNVVTEQQKLIGMSAMSFILIFFMTSVGSVLFSAMGIGLTGVAVHGALRMPDDLFLDDSADTGGFFSFLKAPQATAQVTV